MDLTFVLYILLYLNIISFILGYCLSSIKNVSIYSSQGNTRKKINSDIPVSNIEIEDTKYVVSIDTSNMEKKYESLGDIKTSTNDISNSINKLKNLKG